MYVETRQLTPGSGPSAGMAKAVLDFHTGPDDELVTVWPSTVLRRRLRRELARRKADDFEPGERVVIRRTGTRTGANGTYYDDDVEFEHAAPEPTARDLLGGFEAKDASSEERPAFASDDTDIPF
jgi:hypothetical protein